jgi:uncharacterized membrane protein YheB (UPF0754 family)
MICHFQQESGMNKSFVTNLIAALVVVAGYVSPWFGEQIRTVGFFALSGAVTNWLAIHMLFEKVPLLYGSGVVPNHFEDFKRGIRKLIMQQFFTDENMQKFLSDTLKGSDVQINLDPALEAIDYDAAFSSLTSVILESSFGGMLNLFGGASVLEGFRAPFEQKIKQFVKQQAQQSEFKEALKSSMGDQGDLINSIKQKVELIVESRLEELTPQLVKQIIQDMIARHLGWLVIWGGVFGGLIGLVMSLLPL